MPGVTGTLRHPSTGEVADSEYITFELVDSEGNRIREAYIGTETIVRSSSIQLSSTGFYSASLPASASISPDGTRWLRTLWAGEDTTAQQLTVPVSGTSAETDILAEPLESVSPSALTSMLDRVYFQTNTAALSLNFLQYVLVPNSVITVPDSDTSVLVRAIGNVQPTSSGGWALAIVPEGSTALGTDVAIHWGYLSTGNQVVGFGCEFTLDPHDPGDYQLAIYGATGTNLVAAKSSLTAYAV